MAPALRHHGRGIRCDTRLPLTVLVAANGRVIRKIYGAQDWDSDSAHRLVEGAFGFRF